MRTKYLGETYAHFSPLDLPFVPISLIMSPFCLKKVKDVAQVVILSVWWGTLVEVLLLLARLLLLLLLGLLLLLSRWF